MFSNHLPLLEIVMREDQVCTTSVELVVEDDDLVERVEEWEAFAENSKKTFLRHLLNQVEAAGAVDVAFTVEWDFQYHVEKKPFITYSFTSFTMFFLQLDYI